MPLEGGSSLYGCQMKDQPGPRVHALVQDAPPKDHGGTAVSGAGPSVLQCGPIPDTQCLEPGTEMPLG